MKEIATKTGKSTIFVYSPPNPYFELAYKADKCEREAKEAVRESDRRKLFLHDRLVALKKKKGVQKLNGSLLVDEKGEVMQVVPVALSNGKKCFGLRCVETLKV